MKFSVATNFQDDFIKTINKKEVYEIFGKLNADFIGGGRSSYMLPFVSKDKLRLHIQEAHNAGLQFNYLLNAGCLGNREFTRQGLRHTHKLLEWLQDIGIDSVTVSIPYLLDLIKHKYRNFKVSVSLNARINNLGLAKRWEDLGADRLTLDSSSLNRDFETLRKIRQYIKCDLQLIANNGCLCFCPFQLYHQGIDAHGSQSHHQSKGFVVDYCVLSCRYLRLQEPVNFIRSDWIRPEDVHYYEDIGINSLKIVERSRITLLIALALDAYTKRKYSGNLADLIPTYHTESFLRGSRKLSLAVKYLLRPLTINPFLLKKVYGLRTALDVYIDNQALEGFLKFFAEGNCKAGDCAVCGYCQKIAQRAVKIDALDSQKLIPKYRDLFKFLYK